MRLGYKTLALCLVFSLSTKITKAQIVETPVTSESLAADASREESKSRFDIDIHEFIHANFPKLNSVQLPVGKSDLEAIEYLKAQAGRGDVGCMINLALANIYNKGLKGNPMDINNYAQMASDKGDSRGEIILADSAALGRGVPQDNNQAFVHFRKAALMGNIVVQRLFYQKLLTNKYLDYPQAYYWLSLVLLHSPQSPDLAREKNNVTKHLSIDQIETLSQKINATYYKYLSAYGNPS